MAATPVPALSNRLASLDQFRGYTVAGMFLVNFLGHFDRIPHILDHHNNFCSYADTIMPQFFFAVGFAMRLSFGRRVLSEGIGRAYFHAVKRFLGLALVAVIVYQGTPTLPDGVKELDWETVKTIGISGLFFKSFKNTWFQTLMHIAATSLWILPVIRLRAIVRVLYMIFSAGLHLWLSHKFYTEWINTSPTGIDGGPLGFLTWTIPTIVGTLACDAVLGASSRAWMLSKLFLWAIVLMAFGWLASWGTRWYDLPEGQVAAEKDKKLSETPVFPPSEGFTAWKDALKAKQWKRVMAEPPFIPPPHARDKQRDEKKNKEAEVDNSWRYRKQNYWMMSQRNGTISYLTFAAGLSLAVYALFYILADVIGLRIGVFRTLGSNALFGYVLHDLVGGAVQKFVPADSPDWLMWTSFGIFFFICWLIIRSLEKKGIYIKL